MRPRALIFLDFDGVVHDNFEPPYFVQECLELIDNVLIDFNDVCIVITSEWRLRNSLNDLCELLGPIGERVIGQTPNVHFRRRFHEIEKYLTDTGYKDIPWVAIDDNADLFPVDTPLIQTNGYGISPENAGELRVALEEMIRTNSNNNVNECIQKLYEHPGPKLPKASLKELFKQDGD